MMKNIVNNFTNFVSLTSIFLLLTLASCNSKDRSETSYKDTTLENVDPDAITITENQFKSGKMELGKITMQQFNTVVKANGMFAVPPQNQADVSAYFAGYVKDIDLLPGHAVKKGQVLFTIENPGYVQVQQDFLEAKGRLTYLKSDYERQKELMVDNVTSKKNFLKAESEYTVTLAQYQSLRKKLSLMNIDVNTLSGDNIRSVISVPSPLSGYTTTINASRGMYLNPSDVAVTVTNTDDLHIELKIFEKDLPMVKVGQQINVRLQNDRENVYLGKVHLVNKTINDQERTVAIHGDLSNEEDTKLFAPGMYIEAEIVTTSADHPALPSDAVANIDNDFFVLVKEDNTNFKRVLVKIGTVNNGFTQILNADDFEPNTEFLTKGAFNLITE
ncbi:efflux RND transporter periplasmic adaptor subunit [Arenibacter sp. F20364]|jgi:cobalt-zinc-cadmium efflux system membrane fusion protein|uniref:efflux RND transporter periplasmic adaptor subunit n=1 Tax=Arenibacter sp. F20364 TaxID=2926415 RepID=UPI001FF12604|nr:efflux RND transporter periplasmic adaptor subunit [Arenibacter sp. F20364]MCK0192023.1 efflux RND transporter periplasmic adaptor subunit [Arenibacter sp. F20364]|tara:strand:- start:51580 stop:52743 length:1164 start_codon:yes stop_codon:yes gene_type:complete